MYHVKQMNNGHWYVLRTASDLPQLDCENGGYKTKHEAHRAMTNELSEMIKELRKKAGIKSE